MALTRTYPRRIGRKLETLLVTFLDKQQQICQPQTSPASSRADSKRRHRSPCSSSTRPTASGRWRSHSDIVFGRRILSITTKYLATDCRRVQLNRTLFKDASIPSTLMHSLYTVFMFASADIADFQDARLSIPLCPSGGDDGTCHRPRCRAGSSPCRWWKRRHPHEGRWSGVGWRGMMPILH
jgi:hypothetical protein